jgi:hypothetical protein
MPRHSVLCARVERRGAVLPCYAATVRAVWFRPPCTRVLTGWRTAPCALSRRVSVCLCAPPSLEGVLLAWWSGQSCVQAPVVWLCGGIVAGAVHCSWACVCVCVCVLVMCGLIGGCTQCMFAAHTPPGREPGNPRVQSCRSLSGRPSCLPHFPPRALGVGPAAGHNAAHTVRSPGSAVSVCVCAAGDCASAQPRAASACALLCTLCHMAHQRGCRRWHSSPRGLGWPAVQCRRGVPSVWARRAAVRVCVCGIVFLDCSEQSCAVCSSSSTLCTCAVNRAAGVNRARLPSPALDCKAAPVRACSEQVGAWGTGGACCPAQEGACGMRRVHLCWLV